MSVVDSPSRIATAYQDPNYLPFYFHLGRVVRPEKSFFVGLELGLQIGCVFQGCESPASATCVQPPPDHFYSPRMALSNIKSASKGRASISVHMGSVGEYKDSSFPKESFDLAAILVSMPSDSLMDSMDICWSLLKAEGLLVVDFLDEKRSVLVFSDFCKARGLDFGLLKTRYGAGIAGR